jgi:hypothetical protein
MKEAVKNAIKEVATNLEKGVDAVSEAVEGASDKAAQLADLAQVQVEREVNNRKFPDLQGTRVYTVHFCEYLNGVQTQDIPVYTASSPEWAMGYCKAHTEMAPKGLGTVDWWYFYITEEAINDSQEGQGWIATLDWDGKLRSDTYRIDKGYDHKYVKDHVIYEQDTEGDCAPCGEAEKDEEVKTAERTQAALKEATEFVRAFFGTSVVGTANEGDWVKLYAMDTDDRISDSDYKTLHQKFGIIAGNRILFYTKKKQG